jgi:hypothetical protein
MVITRFLFVTWKCSSYKSNYGTWYAWTYLYWIWEVLLGRAVNGKFNRQNWGLNPFSIVLTKFHSKLKPKCFLRKWIDAKMYMKYIYIYIYPVKNCNYFYDFSMWQIVTGNKNKSVVTMHITWHKLMEAYPTTGKSQDSLVSMVTAIWAGLRRSAVSIPDKKFLSSL